MAVDVKKEIEIEVVDKKENVVTDVNDYNVGSLMRFAKK
jgi:hypothetical protein